MASWHLISNIKISWMANGRKFWAEVTKLLRTSLNPEVALEPQQKCHVQLQGFDN